MAKEVKDTKAQGVKVSKPCTHCDGHGWVYVPYDEPRRGRTGEIEFGEHKRCQKCK